MCKSSMLWVLPKKSSRFCIIAYRSTTAGCIKKHESTRHIYLEGTPILYEDLLSDYFHLRRTSAVHIKGNRFAKHTGLQCFKCSQAINLTWDLRIKEHGGTLAVYIKEGKSTKHVHPWRTLISYESQAVVDNRIQWSSAPPIPGNRLIEHTGLWCPSTS